MAQRVAYPDNPVMAVAFVGFIRWAMCEPEVLDHFNHATGIMPWWTQSMSPLDVLIDQASGYEADVVNKFVDWLVENYWGENPFEGGERG